MCVCVCTYVSILAHISQTHYLNERACVYTRSIVCLQQACAPPSCVVFHAHLSTPLAAFLSLPGAPLTCPFRDRLEHPRDRCSRKDPDHTNAIILIVRRQHALCACVHVCAFGGLWSHSGGHVHNINHFHDARIQILFSHAISFHLLPLLQKCPIEVKRQIWMQDDNPQAQVV